MDNWLNGRTKSMTEDQLNPSANMEPIRVSALGSIPQKIITRKQVRYSVSAMVSKILPLRSSSPLEAL